MIKSTSSEPHYGTAKSWHLVPQQPPQPETEDYKPSSSHHQQASGTKYITE
jgi:hypothetical protein